jgi:hypothetical protein
MPEINHNEYIGTVKIPNVLVNSYMRYYRMLLDTRIIGDQEVEDLILDSMDRVWEVMNEEEQASAEDHRKAYDLQYGIVHKEL